MGEALSIASFLSATPIATVPMAEAPATIGATDPFAALLGALTIAPPATAALPTPLPIAPAAMPDQLLVAIADTGGEADAAETSAPPSDASDDAPAGEDAIGAALDAGLTAVLALAAPSPPMAPPPVVQSAAVPTQAAGAVVSPATARPDIPSLPRGGGGGDDPAPAAAPLDRSSETDKPASPAPAQTASAPPEDAVAAPAAHATIAALRTLLARSATTTPIAAASAAPAETTMPTARKASPDVATDAATKPDTAKPVLPQAHARGSGEATSAPRVARLPGARRTTDLANVATATSAPAGTDTVAPAPSMAAPAADTIVQRQLTIAQDGQWLDTLARDIARSADGGNDLRFKLDPQQLGSLTVSIAQGSDGAAIRMTADNDTTRAILVDAQPKLVAEAHAQGLKISETHVDLSNSGGGSGQSAWQQAGDRAGQDGRRAPSALPQPLAASIADDASAPAASRDAERYA